jgi:hypothetical protein
MLGTIFAIACACTMAGLILGVWLGVASVSEDDK